MHDLTPEQIKQMITMLQSMLPQEATTTNVDTVDNKDAPHNNNIKTSKRRPQPSSVNKFDAMAEARMHKDDIAIDKKLNKYGPTPRTRKFEFINVKCRVCGKNETINPVLLYETPDRYKCNKCSGSAG
jgi:hypothetical protein